MRFDIVTLFPEMLRGPFAASIVSRAVDRGIAEIELHDLRQWGHGKHRKVDDAPFGGGAGMVMQPEPLFAAVESIPGQAEARTVLLTPQGRLLTQAVVDELAAVPHLLLLCGHYEGVDERVREHLADDEISIGDYVLSGGEPAAIVLVDAIVRRLPGALGSEASLDEESHTGGLLEYPQYTRPAEYRGWPIPDILLSGHHKDVQTWRRRQSLLRTARRRPDLLRAALASDGAVSDADRRWLEEELETKLEEL